ncbi:MAG: polysialyltransferase family glycosyltransferase [Oscillospiraceae bacterium]
MVLYYVKTVFQLLEAIVHKVITHKTTTATLLIQPYLIKKFPEVEALKQFGFEQIVSYNTNEITSTKTSDATQLLEDITSYYDTLLQENKIDLERYQEIYLFASLRFSIYLCQKQQQFSLFEDATGTASRNGFVQWRNETDCVDKTKLAERFSLLNGNNQYIKRVIYALDLQSARITNPNSYHFNLTQSLQLLNEKERQEIVSFFFKYPTTLDPNCSLLLTQYYFPNDTNLVRNQAEVVKLYQKLADYYAKGSGLVIKPHPIDPIDYSSFVGARLMRKRIPSELLCLVACAKLVRVVTLCSTAVRGMLGVAEDVVAVGDHFCYVYPFVDCLFVGLSIVNLLKDFQLPLFVFGLFQDQVDCLLKYHFPELEETSNGGISPERGIVLVDRIDWGDEPIEKRKLLQSLSLSSGDAVYIFINSKEDFCFYDTAHRWVLEYIVPITIKRIGFDGTGFEGMLEDTIYVFSKNVKLLQRVRQFTMHKRLQYSGQTLNVFQMSDESVCFEQLKVRIAVQQKSNLELENRMMQIKKKFQ